MQCAVRFGLSILSIMFYEGAIKLKRAHIELSLTSTLQVYYIPLKNENLIKGGFRGRSKNVFGGGGGSSAQI